MPLKAHYGGDGAEVAAAMKKRYGKDWRRIFYATENAQKRKRKEAALKAMHGGR